MLLYDLWIYLISCIIGNYRIRAQIKGEKTYYYGENEKGTKIKRSFPVKVVLRIVKSDGQMIAKSHTTLELRQVAGWQLHYLNHRWHHQHIQLQILCGIIICITIQLLFLCGIIIYIEIGRKYPIGVITDQTKMLYML